MNLKSQLLELLEENRGTYLSGGTLAKELGVSRNAVWKSVESLRADGYGVSAVTNKGYSLESVGDILSATKITALIKTGGVFNVEVRKSVSSTNTVLRDLAEKGAPEGHVLVAEEQTAGKGRHGREFFSPAGHGAYFSLLLRPVSKTTDSALITSAASVAAARAIEEVTGVHVGIKWVNDLYVGGRKVCGILTEGTFSMESGTIESAILGIGINVTRPEDGFPGTLKEYAASLVARSEGKANERCRIIASTLDNFWEFYKDLSARGFLSEYRARSIVTGREIVVLSGDEAKPAFALEIDDDCRLVVRYGDGRTAALESGEVSIRQV
jgi:BirA family biotin operon repressor/biotin-[acetyl-CoA-carboxylase] ligase